MAQSQASQQLGAGCGVLFALPFIGFGLYIAATTARGALADPGRLERWLPVGFGLLFAGVGVAIALGALVGARKLAAARRLREANPGEPWRWREDWAAGLIRHSARGSVIGPWLFALFWNAISMPAAFLGLPKLWREGNWAGLLLLLFPLVGVLLLAWAIHSTLRALRFGDSELQLETVPAPVGGILSGSVSVRGDWAQRHGAILRLLCVRRVTTGSGKQRSTRETVLAELQETLPPGGASGGPRGEFLPIRLALPSEGEPTDQEDVNNQVLWKLEVRSPDIPGVDFFATFELPVFGRTTGTESAAGVPAAEPAPLPPDPRRMETSISGDPMGGVRYALRPFRQPWAAIGLGLFMLAWSGGLVLMVVKGAPIPALVVVGLFYLLFAWVWLQLALGASEVRIVNGELRFRGGLFARGRERSWTAGEIAGFTIKPGMTAGNTSYYDVHLQPRSGGAVRVLASLREREEARWLAAELAQALGIKPDPAA